MSKLVRLLLILATLPAYAQTTQTYTGVIKDLTQQVVTSGQVTFTLTLPNAATIPGVGTFVPTTTLCNINADGTLSGFVAGVVSGACIVTANISLTPTGTAYRICEQPYFSTPGSCFYDYALGGTKDISSVVPTLPTGPINYGGIPGPQGPQGIQGPIGAPTSGVNLTPAGAQTVTQPGTTALSINNLLPTNEPFKCVETFLPSDVVHGGTDYGAAISAAVQASPLGTVTDLRVCAPGDHPVYTTAVFDRPIAFKMEGQSRLIPQAAMSSAPVKVTAVATAGSNVLSMASSAGLLAGMACGGVGILPGAYIVSTTSTSVTLSLNSKVDFYAVATAGSPTLTGISSLAGVATGQTLTGSGIAWPYTSGTATISSINYAANTITLGTNANNGSSIPDSFVVGGTWTTNLSCVKQTPVLQWIYNASALKNQYTYMIGASMRDVWIASDRSLSGVQGVQISGYDNFMSYHLRVESLNGSGEILGGYVGTQLANQIAAVRESQFIGDQIYYDGDASTGQAALAILTPNETAAAGADEINEISLTAGHYVCFQGVGVAIGTFNTGHATGPDLIYFESGAQVEGCPVKFDTAAQSDAVFIEKSNDVRFSDAELAVPGQGKSLIHLQNSRNLHIVNTSLFNQAIQSTYMVAVTAGLTTATYVSGGGTQNTFNTVQSWDGIGVQLNGVLMHLAPLSPVAANGLTLQLASPWAGASGTFAMIVGYGGAFLFSSDASLTRVDVKGIHTPGDLSQTNSLLGVTTFRSLFEVGNSFDGSAGALMSYDDLDGAHATIGPFSFRMGGDPNTVRPGTQLAYDINLQGETDIINTNAGLAGGYCYYSVANNGTPTTPTHCFTGTGGGLLHDTLAVAPLTDTYAVRLTPSSDTNTNPDIHGTNAANSADNWKIGRTLAQFPLVNSVAGYQSGGVAGQTFTITVTGCIINFVGGLATSHTGASCP